MSTIELFDDEYEMEIYIREVGDELIASTEYNFVKYESYPVRFSMNKFKKIYDRVDYKIDVGDAISILYEDPNTNFELGFVMRSFNRDALQEIKHVAENLFQLRTSVSAIVNNLYFGLEVVNERVKFYSTKKGMRVEGRKGLVKRLSQLLTHMECDFGTYETLETAEHDILPNIAAFCAAVPGQIFRWHYLNSEEKNSKKLVAELIILFFPEYAVLDEYRDFVKKYDVVLGDIRHGYSAMQDKFVAGGRVILWHPNAADLDFM
jgi:hypothetical protein